MTQDTLNNIIAEEMNKWQPIYEYASLFIDRANERNKKFKLIIWLYKKRYTELIVTLLCGILTYYQQAEILKLAFAITMVLLLLFIIGKIWPDIVDDSNIKELNSMQIMTNLYLANLRRWLQKLDLHVKVTSKEVSFVEQEYYVANTAQALLFDRYSTIHGKLDKDLNTRAKERANDNLKPFQRYITYE